ncbi:type VI secretion system tip protein VgrG [Pyxidicoccus fallax]|uniref:Type VI secretion system tip protein VgrG n=1 Tax=Pyxidicoccus fallax TaxID=394095 RepID=A0A848LNR0_9BACT|nr:type VI secretion system tip protein TssI/VgrG [Pyxidicoccus fallax]NMO19478.1 type VI secretion system tip protein VgrG [Pyxidicoccus fallax]NPC81934.1 type VI secretion system tip protein VgrG [Pyxidicoccus fallax]
MSVFDERRQQLAQVAATASQVARSLGAGDAVEALSGVLSLLGGGDPVSAVRYTFSSADAPLAPWHVRRVQAREGLSELYEALVDLVFDGPLVDVEAMLGASCTLGIQRGTLSRRILGIVRHVEDLGSLADKAMIRVHVVPALWELTQRVDSYIFQEMSVPEVLLDVMEEALTPFKRKVRLSLQREYPKREYCVQYAESDLDFVLRLMKEEGIAFYFEHAGDAEELVLVDTNAPFQPLPTLDGGPVWIANQAGGLAHVETLQGFDWSSTLRPTGVVVRDFDWTRPKLNLTKEVREEQESGRESYLYPAELTLSEYDKENHRYTKEDVATRAGLLRQGQQLSRRKGRGRGNVTGFCPGYTFELQGHARAELDQAYLITRVEHLGEAPEERPLFSPEDSGEGTKRERYENRFECVPLSVPFRPEYPLARSRIPGLQTATVVGPAEEEIHTDVHGRIKVRFHWDRVGPQDDKASCWVRVAQSWAGPGFGTLFIPRVGMEVVVDFLEGNPDRPLVIGCVYNGSNPPPVKLPEERTRSTLRTQSSPKSLGYNELRFEDAKGEEQVFLHAQKDLVEVVEHDHTTQVNNDQANTVEKNQTNTVKVNQTESVGGEQTMTVSGNRTKTVKKDETVTVEQNRTETVKANETITVNGNRTFTVDGKETYSVGGTRDKKVTGKETVTLEAGRQTTVTTNDELTVSAERLVTADVKHQLTQGPTTFTFEGGHVELDAGSYIKLVHGSGEVHIEDSGKISVSSGTEISLSCGGCSITLTPTKIEISGAVEVSLAGGAGTVKLDPTGVAVAGPKVSSAGSAMNEITGALVKIN